MGRRHKQAISNRIRDNDISFFPMLRQFTSSSNYQSHGNNEKRKINDPTSRLEAGSSALSGVPGCDDCFLGLQVSRREAYVELFEKLAEWVSFLVANHLYPDPELFEHESNSEAKVETP